MKNLQRFFLISIITMVFISVVLMNREPEAVSEITNARLAAWDKEKFSPRAIDAYINDRIGLYDQAITSYIWLNDRAFHVMEHPNYEYGQNDLLFMNYSEEVIDRDFLYVFAKFLRKIQDDCEKQGIPFIYCLNPSKNTVYQDDLADGYHPTSLMRTYFEEKLQENGVRYITNVDELRQRAQTEQVYNIKYDAGHWNELGQFYGTNHLLREVRKDFPEVQELSFDDFEIRTIIEEYLPVSRHRVNEEVPRFALKAEVKRTTEEYNDVTVHERHPHFATYRHTDGEQLPTALFFHGSYYNKTAEFYKGAFREIYTVHNYENLLNYQYYIDRFNPDIVLLETAEYATGRNYFNLKEMQEQLGLDTD